MKAVHLNEYGPAENLKLVDIPLPIPAENEVLIKVKASSVIFADILMRRGDYPALPASLPFVPGREVAGIAEKVGGKCHIHQAWYACDGPDAYRRLCRICQNNRE